MFRDTSQPLKSKVFSLSLNVSSFKNANQQLKKNIKDSIYKTLFTEEMKKFPKELDDFKIGFEIPIIVGWLDLKKAIPFFKKVALLDTVHYSKWSIELALAKLGDKKLEKKL